MTALKRLLEIKEADPAAIIECEKLLKDLKYRHFGIQLENKFGMDLRNSYKIYFYNRKYRLVYSKNGNVIRIVGAGKREGLEVYKDVFKNEES
jgi:hypothetical protein